MSYWVDGSEHHTQMQYIFLPKSKEAQQVLCLIFSGRWYKVQQLVFHLGGIS